MLTNALKTVNVFAVSTLFISLFSPIETMAAGDAVIRERSFFVSHQDTTVSGATKASWVDMPAGTVPTFIGIHGGTVPVSLLAAGDDVPMVALVGQTGNDFLQMLRGSNATAEADLLEGVSERREIIREQRAALPTGNVANATVLTADTAGGNVPVIYATGHAFEQMDLQEGWSPFGLSEKPLGAEGVVKKKKTYKQ